MLSDPDSLKAAAIGVIAGVFSRTLTAPLDLVKIRMQIQNPHYRSYSSIPNAFAAISKQEGMKAFWKGNSSGIMLYGSYSGAQFYCYSQLDGLPTMLRGAAAASLATVLTYPFDSTRTRLALRANIRARTVIARMIKEEGLLAVYKGLLPTIAQVAPYMGTVFWSYDCTKKLLRKNADIQADITNTVAGAVSGACGKLATMPFDVVRKRMQIQGSEFQQYQVANLQRFASLRHCIVFIWINEGLRGFYNGLAISLVKSMSVTSTTFLIYGFLERVLVQKTRW